tara:strand:- start:57 stop:392 length:336 start_codon:yes stop_codon:yes gene_type:complete
MSTRYNPAGLMYTALNNARKLSRSAAAKKRGASAPDDYPPALMKTKKAPSVKGLNLVRRADEAMAFPTLAEADEEKGKKKKKVKKKRMERRKGESKKIYERKNISEKTRWM